MNVIYYTKPRKKLILQSKSCKTEAVWANLICLFLYLFIQKSVNTDIVWPINIKMFNHNKNFFFHFRH